VPPRAADAPAPPVAESASILPPAAETDTQALPVAASDAHAPPSIDGSEEALRFYREQIQACNDLIRRNPDRGRTSHGRAWFDGSEDDPSVHARISEALGEGRFVLIDGAHTELVVDLRNRRIMPRDGPMGALATIYTVCDESIFVGSTC
jgi:hypothetical protein